GVGYVKTMSHVKKLANFSCASLITLKKKGGIKRSVVLKMGGYGDGPAVYGVFHSIIVLTPESLTTIDEILLHELVHVKSKDNLKKIFFQLVLCIHWFNPLVWFAGRQFHKDIELSCDEKVIEMMGYENRGIYANAILHFAERKGHMGGNRFASFGKNPVLGRIKNIVKLRHQSVKMPVIFMAVVLFLFTGAVSDPVRNLSGQFFSYALEPKFATVKLTEQAQEKVTDYAIEGENLYYIIANTTPLGELVPGYKIGVYNQRTQKKEILVTGAETTVEDSFHYAKGKVYYVVKWTDSVGNWTSVVSYDLSSKTQSTLWGGHQRGLQDIRISGDQSYLSWHKILAPNGVFKEDQLLIWDIEKGKIIEKLEANGNQNYLDILDGFVTYQRDSQFTGKTQIVRHEIKTGKELVVKNLLSHKPYSAYGNGGFVVYKEDYEPSSKIIIYNVNEEKNDKLWDALKKGIGKESRVTIEELKEYEKGIWGINLVKNKLLLTGESNTILEVDLNNFQITDIQSQENLHTGFYRTKIGEDVVSSMQYDYDVSGQMINRLFYGKLIGK
ncbi:MAG: M56 family metallopeptidase, partial [Anaerovorax sp.]